MKTENILFWYAVTVATASLGYFGLGVMFFFRKNRRQVDFIFSLLLLTIFWWSFCVSMHALMHKNSDAAQLWIYSLHLGAVFVPITFVHFIDTLIGKMKKSFIYTNYFIGLFFILLMFFPGHLFIKEISPIGVFKNFPKAGPLYSIYLVFFSSLVIYGMHRLYTNMAETSGISKNQLQYIFWGAAISFPLGASAFLPEYDINISYPFGTPFILIFVISTTYAILRYRLMDFGLLLRWGMVYGIFLTVLAGLLGTILAGMEKLTHLYFGAIPGIPTLVSACVLVACYEPLRKRIRTFVDHFIFRAPDLKEILNRIDTALHDSKNLPDLIEKLAMKLKETWRVEHAGVAMWLRESERFECFPTEAFKNKAISNANERIDQNDFLVKTLEKERRLFKEGIITQDEVTALANQSGPGEQATLWKIRRTMRWLGAAVCVPVMNGQELTGFILLGQKKDRTSFNDEDKKILTQIGQMVSMVLRSMNRRPDQGNTLWPLNPQPFTAG